MISIDVNSLNDREKIADAIAELTTVLTALDAAAERRTKVRGLLDRDDIAEYAKKVIAENIRGHGLAPYLVEALRRCDVQTVVKPGADLQGREELLRKVHSGEATRGLKERLGLLPYTFNGMDPQEAIQHNGIICLIDGEKRKFLSRYVRQVHCLGWEEYLRRFDLPSDYPRTSKDVIAQRSKAATERGFGKHDRTPDIDEQIHITAPVVRRTFGRRPVSPQVSVNIDIGGATVSAQTDRELAAELGRKLRGFL